MYVSALGLQPSLFKEDFMFRVCSDLAKELLIFLRRVPVYLLQLCYGFGNSVFTQHAAIIGIAKQVSKKSILLYVAIHPSELLVYPADIHIMYC